MIPELTKVTKEQTVITRLQQATWAAKTKALEFQKTFVGFSIELILNVEGVKVVVSTQYKKSANLVSWIDIEYSSINVFLPIIDGLVKDITK